MSKFRIGFPLAYVKEPEFVLVQPSTKEGSVSGWLDEEDYRPIDFKDSDAPRIALDCKPKGIAWRSFIFSHISPKVLDPHEKIRPAHWNDRSGLAACMLALAQQAVQKAENGPIVLISCNSHGNNFQDAHLAEVSTSNDDKTSVKSLVTKWRGALESKNVLALVLHENDAEKLKSATSKESIPLRKGLFSELPSNGGPYLVSVKSDQISELAEELGISPVYFISRDADVPDGHGDLAIMNWLQKKGYTEIERIGRGGIGIVFKARDYESRKIVAIKCLAPEHWTDDKLRKRFRNGFNLLLKLSEQPSDPGVSGDTNLAKTASIVVPYKWIEEDSQCLCYSMEYIQGCDLSKYISDSPTMSPYERWLLFNEIVKAVALAHKKGIFHRDLHPTNILIRQDTKQVVLTDFDMAYSPDSSLSVYAQPLGGHLLFTPPEGMHPSSPNAPVMPTYDIFQLGRLFHFSMIGQRPDVTDGANPATYLETLKRARLTEGLARIVLNCVNQKPIGRYQTIDALMRDLVAIDHAFQAGGDEDINIIDKTWIPTTEVKRQHDLIKSYKDSGLFFAGFCFLSIIAIILSPATFAITIPDSLPLYVVVSLWLAVSGKNLFVIHSGPDDFDFLIDAGFRLNSANLQLMCIIHIMVVLARYVAIYIGIVKGSIAIAFGAIALLEFSSNIMWFFKTFGTKPKQYADPNTAHARAAIYYYSLPHYQHMLVESVILFFLSAGLYYQFDDGWIALTGLIVIYATHEIIFNRFRKLRNAQVQL